jgi:hypothetical protein
MAIEGGPSGANESSSGGSIEVGAGNAETRTAIAESPPADPVETAGDATRKPDDGG